MAPAALEADEFAAAFVAANKPSAKTRRMDYIAKAERETNPERKLHLLKAAENYGPGGRYADCVGGGVRLVNRPGLMRSRPLRLISSISTT